MQFFIQVAKELVVNVVVVVGLGERGGDGAVTIAIMVDLNDHFGGVFARNVLVQCR